MTNYNLTLTFESIITITRMFLDIVIMWFAIYYTIKIIRNNSRTSQIFKGIVLFVVIDIITKFLGLKTVAWLADLFVNWGFLAIFIVFQPEIRSLLERIGKSSIFSRITSLSGNEREHLVDQIVTATMLLSKNQTGALISIERAHSLNDFVKSGTPINSIVTAELLTSIFVTSTPLHDGAVIIQGDRIACASAYFPPTNLNVPSKYGARHRAAIGISEITDAITIVVSEETGSISVTESGKILTLSSKGLRDYLLRTISGEETEMKKTRPAGVKPNIIITDNNKGEEYIIEDKAEKKFETAVLDKLAIRKQMTNEEKVMTEKPSKPKEKKKSRKSFGIFNKEEKTEPKVVNKPLQEEVQVQDEKMAQLEKEEMNIKLPKKKERPVDYTYHSENVRVMGLYDKDNKVVKQEELVLPKKEEQPQEEKHQEEIYDTTAINISEIMGFSNELDSTLSMVDSLKTKKQEAAFSDVEEIRPPVKNEGGDR